LIYLGDEVGQLNDYTYRSDPAKANDSRWVHRPAANWEVYERRHIPGTLEERVYSGIQHLIQLRKTHRAFSGQEPQVLDSGNEHILAYARGQAKERLVVYANFSEQQQTIPKNQLRICGLGAVNEDLLSNKTITVEDLLLEPYQLIFLTER
jgi:glycosidase